MGGLEDGVAGVEVDVRARSNADAAHAGGQGVAVDEGGGDVRDLVGLQVRLAREQGAKQHDQHDR